jgi:hypothetical protein
MWAVDNPRLLGQLEIRLEGWVGSGGLIRFLIGFYMIIGITPSTKGDSLKITRSCVGSYKASCTMDI